MEQRKINVRTGIQTAMGDVVKTARQVLKIDVEPDWGPCRTAAGIHMFG